MGKNEVVKKESGQVAMSDAFKLTPDMPKQIIDGSDIIIPRLLVMQGLSTFVTEGKAKFGEIVDSLTLEALGGLGKETNFVPLIQFKTVGYYEKQGTANPKFIRRENWDAAKHANLEWEFVENGKTIQANQELNFYVMLERDLEQPGTFPYLLVFRRAGYRNGKKLMNHFMQTQARGFAPIGGIFALTSTKQVNDDGQVYSVFDLRPVGNTPGEYAPLLMEWVKTLSKGQHKVDATDEDAPAAAPQAQAKRGNVDNTAQF